MGRPWELPWPGLTCCPPRGLLCRPCCCSAINCGTAGAGAAPGAACAGTHKCKGLTTACWLADGRVQYAGVSEYPELGFARVPAALPTAPARDAAPRGIHLSASAGRLARAGGPPTQFQTRRRPLRERCPCACALGRVRVIASTQRRAQQLDAIPTLSCFTSRHQHGPDTQQSRWTAIGRVQGALACGQCALPGSEDSTRAPPAPAGPSMLQTVGSLPCCSPPHRT